jgi:probable HAF family extracellular repeat protein
VSLLPSVLQGQTKASCNFSLFTFPTSVPQGDFADGVNSFATVVGTLEETNHSKVGFMRFSGGSFNFFAPGVPTQINARNDVGNSIGNEFTSPPKGFFLHGSSGVTYIVHSNDANGTFPRGINKSNVVVGFYLDGNSVAHGFKWINGTFTSLHFPNALSTAPTGINDNGQIVGSYGNGSGTHGFLFSGGAWKTIDFPNVPTGTTELLGISNAGVIIGINTAHTPNNTYFMYKSGVFKVISDPQAAGGTMVLGIAANGLMTGDVYLTTNASSNHGFLAACQ